MMTYLRIERNFGTNCFSQVQSFTVWKKDYIFIECVQFSLLTCVMGAMPMEKKLKFHVGATQIKIIA